MNSITRIREYIRVNFPEWEKVDYSEFDGNIDFRTDMSELYKIADDEVILISYTNISITGSDRPKPQLRVFLDEYKKPFYFAKKHQLRYYLFSIFTKEDSMARGLDKFNPKEYVISIETNLDIEGSRRDLRSIYDYANEKLNGRKFLKCSRDDYKVDINEASFIYVGSPEHPYKDVFENFINIFDSRPYLNSTSDIQNHINETRDSNLPLQQIFYGAPGTGKSHTIKDCTKGKDVIRTTFHPDSDYSTFVGAYKPTTKEVPVYSPFGEKVVVAKDTDGKPIVEDKIVYEFVEQAFLQAYINAWTKYADTQDGEQPKEQYLIIEEINRGNCAQIFGDLFQLLDRNDAGFSDYPIKADNDMAKHLKKALGNLEIKAKERINGLYSEEYDDVIAEVLEGRVLLLPNNLFIWATMNTSDQSLFPIDSAFKRRWEWKYIPIANADKSWVIEANGNRYDWWAFLEKINSVVCDTTSSEDKKLGYFFAKADGNGVISSDKFVGKVAFHLWNDVFKDYGFDNDIFKGDDGKPIAFQEFFLAEGKANEMLVEKFLKNLGLDEATEDDVEDEDDENAQRDFTRYEINGNGNFSKRQVAAELVKQFIDGHPDKTAEEVLKEWKTIPKLVPHFVESQYEYENIDNRADKETRMRRIECHGEYIYVATHGWSKPDKMKKLQDAISSRQWGLKFSAIDNND